MGPYSIVQPGGPGGPGGSGGIAGAGGGGGIGADFDGNLFPGDDGNDGLDGSEGANRIAGPSGLFSDRLLSDAPGLANGDFSDGSAFFRQSGQGQADVIQDQGDSFLELSVDTGEISVSQLVFTDPGAGPVLLALDYDFLTTGGTLEVLLDLVDDGAVIVLLEVGPGGPTSAFGTPVIRPSPFGTHVSLVIDPLAFPAPAAATSNLTLRLLPGSLAQVAADDVVYTPVPEPSAEALLGIGALAMLARRRTARGRAPNAECGVARFW